LCCEEAGMANTFLSSIDMDCGRVKTGKPDRKKGRKAAPQGSRSAQGIFGQFDFVHQCLGQRREVIGGAQEFVVVLHIAFAQ